jgi:hypothetical protein
MVNFLISTAYIQHLFHTNPNILTIEVWDKVLYARMKKGGGRNKFISKNNLKFILPIYYVEFKECIKQFHPDKFQQTSKKEAYTELSKSIISLRESNEHIFRDGRENALQLISTYEEFTELTSVKFSRLRDRLKNEQFERLLKSLERKLYPAGFDDYSCFDDYEQDSTGWYYKEQSDSINEEASELNDIEKEILERLVQTLHDKVEKERREEKIRKRHWQFSNLKTIKDRQQRISQYLYYRYQRNESDFPWA